MCTFFQSGKNPLHIAALADIYRAAPLTTDNTDPGIVSDVFHSY